jgi:hypothetical protein
MGEARSVNKIVKTVKHYSDPIKFAWESINYNKPFPRQLEKAMMSTHNRGDNT